MKNGEKNGNDPWRSLFSLPRSEATPTGFGFRRDSTAFVDSKNMTDHLIRQYLDVKIGSWRGECLIGFCTG
jgi:hypothetical protein